VTFRERALRYAIAEIGVSEVGFNNRGPRVDEYQRVGTGYVGWVGFPWCAAFVSWCFLKAGYDVTRIPLRASVGFFESWARKSGYVVDRPMRGDLFHWRIDGDAWPDHIGFVERVISLGPVLVMQTVEGNTSRGDGGSQDDGGGVYRRRRAIARSKVVFTRIPGVVPGSVPAKPVTKPKAPSTSSAAFWKWVRWWRGHGEYAEAGARNPRVRPNVPKTIPAAWWRRLKRNTKGA
jgi:hypothetical protein